MCEDVITNTDLSKDNQNGSLPRVMSWRYLELFSRDSHFIFVPLCTYYAIPIHVKFIMDCTPRWAQD